MRSRALLLALAALASCAAGVLCAVDRADAFASGYSEKSHSTACSDTQPECADWADSGECELNPGAPACSACARDKDARQPSAFAHVVAGFMHGACAKSCGVGVGCEAKAKAVPVFRKPWTGACNEGDTRSFAFAHSDAADGHFRRDPHLLGEYLTPGQRVRSNPWVMLSSLGVGTYLGAEDDATDAAVTRAVHASVRAGFNVIDTAINYRGERGEKAVGACTCAGATGRRGVLADAHACTL
jgi:hypothetical protein